METPSFNVSALLATTCVLLAAAVAQAEPALKTLNVHGPDFQDVAGTLGIRTLFVEVTLSEPVTHVGFGCDVYKNGALQRDASFKGTGLSGGSNASARFALWMVDLDALPLQPRNPNHYRMHMVTEVNGTTGINDNDVPKTAFEVATYVFGSFPVGAGSGKRLPLFFVVGKNQEQHFSGGGDPETVLKNHPQADVLIAYLEVGE